MISVMFDRDGQRILSLDNQLGNIKHKSERMKMKVTLLLYYITLPIS